MEQAQQCTLSHARGDDASSREPQPTLSGPCPRYARRPRPAPHSRTFQNTSTQGRPSKPPTRTRSLEERARRRRTDNLDNPAALIDAHARARATSASRHGRVRISTPIHGPCFFRTHRLGGGCRQCPADVSREWIGQRCTDHHRRTPAIHAPGTSRQCTPSALRDPHPSRSTRRLLKAAKLSPPVKSAQNSNTSPPDRLPAVGNHRTTWPRRIATVNSPLTHTASRRNGPPAPPPRTFLSGTFSDQRHTTGARVGVNML